LLTHTSDSGVGVGGSGIAHTRDTVNSGYSSGVSVASVAPAAVVDHFLPKTDLAPVIAVTAPDVNSVAFAASAGTNDNSSGWGDFQKPLDMLLEEEFEMWKQKENYSMDEGAQEDERFEMERDNEETGGRESSSSIKNSEEDDECWKFGSDSNRGIRYSRPRTTSEGRSTQKRQSTRHSKIKFGRRGLGHEKKRV